MIGRLGEVVGAVVTKLDQHCFPMRFMDSEVLVVVGFDKAYKRNVRLVSSWMAI